MKFSVLKLKWPKCDTTREEDLRKLKRKEMKKKRREKIEKELKILVFLIVFLGILNLPVWHQINISVFSFLILSN